MKTYLSLLGTAASLALVMSASTGAAATFSELDVNPEDGVLTEQEFVDALGTHHGAIAYRQYNTNSAPIDVEVQSDVEINWSQDEGTQEYMVEDPVTKLMRAPTEEELTLITDSQSEEEFSGTITKTVTTTEQIEGVTEDEVRRSQRGFERSNAGKARSYANKQMAEENKANAGSKSSGASTESSNGRSSGSNGNKGGNGKNK